MKRDVLRIEAPGGPSSAHAVFDALDAEASFEDVTALIDTLLEAVWIVDGPTLGIVCANRAAGSLFGLPRETLRGRDVTSLAATPEELLFWSDVAAGICEPIHSESHVRRFDGTLVPVNRRVTPLAGSGGTRFVVAMQDRSEQRRGEEERETLLSELRATLESTADGILVLDLAGRIRAFNQRFASMWGLPEDLLVQRDDSAITAWMRRSVTDPEAYLLRLEVIAEATLLQASDVIRLHGGRVLERMTLPQCSRGRPIGRVYSFRDITDHLAANQRIEELSQTDGLTRLPNRTVLAHRFDYALAMTRREGTPFATLLLDVDRFKHLNDTFGQDFGDRVLFEVAERLRGSVRQVDTLARLGGDQFVVLVHAADSAGAEVAARRIMEAINRPFMLDGLTFTVTCSIGIALHPGDGTSMDDLIRHAGDAMHRVKGAGRAHYRFHLARPDVDLRAQIRLDHAMRQGLARGDFRLHFQPQYGVDGELLGAEALLRWNDREFGEVPPGRFIPVAEESGFIVTLGQWVLDQAVRQSAAWRRAGHEVPVAVNVSALQFQQHDFVSVVDAALRASGLEPHLLELELTESILVHDATEALARLQALADLGVCLAIDDFGTGYSSLAYLKRFPIQRLKLDRTFVSGLPYDESDAAITTAVVSMARALKLKVIAEGVETAEQRDFLREVGCDQYQGYLFSPPLPVETFERAMLSAGGSSHLSAAA